MTRRLAFLRLPRVRSRPSRRFCSRADGPADNQADSVRRIPKLGIEVVTAGAGGTG